MRRERNLPEREQNPFRTLHLTRGLIVNYDITKDIDKAREKHEKDGFTVEEVINSVYNCKKDD